MFTGAGQPRPTSGGKEKSLTKTLSKAAMSLTGTGQYYNIECMKTML